VKDFHAGRLGGVRLPLYFYLKKLLRIVLLSFTALKTASEFSEIPYLALKI